MAGPLSLYDQAALRIEGRYLEQCTGVSASFISADKVIHILGGGSMNWMLVCPGERAINLEWRMACATDDVEDLRLIRKWRNCEPVRIGIDMMGSRLGISTKGFLQSPSLRGQVGSALEYSMSAICNVTDFL